MRVLHLYSGNLYGGIETVLVTLARARARCPAMTSVFGLCFEGRLSAELTEAGAAVHQLGAVRFSRPTSLRRARGALRELCRTSSFDVAVVHSGWALAVFGSTVRAVGLPLVLWLHNPFRARHWLDTLARQHPPDLVLGNSRYTAATAARDYPGVPVTTVYSPVAPSPPASPADRQRVRRELDTPDAAVVVVQASRLESWKGHHSLIEALATLRAVPDWTAWVLGGVQRPFERRYLDELRGAARETHIADRVRFAGERADVGTVLQAGDIYCQPNHQAEPFGVVFIEALSAGVPVVTTDLGGPSEIVDDTCGVLVPPGETRALAAALHDLIGDRRRREALGAQGPRRAAALCDIDTQLEALRRTFAGVADTVAS